MDAPKNKVNFNIRYLLVAIVLAALGGLGASNHWLEQGERGLSVHFIDVGQGDAILVDLGTNEVLIDGGEKSLGPSDYISSYIDGPLEAMVATHVHADHIGGLAEVLNKFQVESVWLNGDEATSKTYQDFMTAVNSEGAEVNQAERGDTFSLGNLTFTVLSPSAGLFDDANNQSIVLRMAYGSTTFLFTGDAEEEAETEMLSGGNEVRTQILKAGHHCSRTASSKEFLDALGLEIAICSVGEANTYGHPHQETLDAFQERGAGVYRTDVSGTIIVSSDGTSYTIKTEK